VHRTKCGWKENVPSAIPPHRKGREGQNRGEDGLLASGNDSEEQTDFKINHQHQEDSGKKVILRHSAAEAADLREGQSLGPAEEAASERDLRSREKESILKPTSEKNSLKRGS